MALDDEIAESFLQNWEGCEENTSETLDDTNKFLKSLKDNKATLNYLEKRGVTSRILKVSIGSKQTRPKN